jgi:toxin ParE1/3/4
MELVWLPRARHERRSQISYIASENPFAALDVGLRLRNAIENLTEFPAAGRPGRLAGTRELFVHNTSLIAIYRIRNDLDEIHILRVLHAKQKWPPE